MPKERFVLYSDAGRGTHSTPLLGWACWDHCQQALALNRVIADREANGWDDDRLVPLVAGLPELQPWVEQWYGAFDPVQSVDLVQHCRAELAARAAEVGRTPRPARSLVSRPTHQGPPTQGVRFGNPHARGWRRDPRRR